ncbi:MAG: cytochrome c [Desulfobacterales bacterium]
MRRTLLKRTTAGVAAFAGAMALLLGLWRTVMSDADPAARQEGALLFESKGCVQCHYPDLRETQVGPGLKGLFERDRLPVSGKPLSEANVRQQLETPYQNMPAYADRLSQAQREALIGYLKEL